MRSVEGCAAPGRSAMGESAKASSLQTAGHSTDTAAVASTAAPDMPPASAGPAADSKPALAPEVRLLAALRSIVFSQMFTTSMNICAFPPREGEYAYRNATFPGCSYGVMYWLGQMLHVHLMVPALPAWLHTRSTTLLGDCKGQLNE